MTIVKQTVPQSSGGQQFGFAGDLGAFALSGGGSSTRSDLGPGTYVVTEALPAGWELTQITCTDPDGGSTVNLATATASIDLDAGEQVTCTFRNTQQGSVTIVKETLPVDAGGQQFGFAGDLGAFALTGGGSRTTSDLEPGSYDITEALPAGWELTQITCVDPDGGSVVNLATATATVDLDAGEQVTCTFRNTQQGSLTIVKQTVPQDSGGQQFGFAGDLGAFSLTGGGSRTTSNLAPGSYDITEALPADWELTQISCTDPDGGSTFNLATSTASIDLDAGEHVTCTFLNTAAAVSAVTIVKQTLPQDSGGQQFAFAGDLGAFALTGGDSTTMSDLEPGTFAVSEALPAGWELTQVTCVDPDGGSVVNLATATASIDLDAGEHVTCTFLNSATAVSSVTIVKQTLPQDSGGQQFAFAGDLDAFSLTGGDSSTVTDLEPGTYAVSEALPAGWELTQITCVDPDGGSVVNLATATASIDLDAGEHVTCTFLNSATAVSSVTVVKQTSPSDSGGQLFSFAGDLGAFSVLGGESSTVTDLEAGSYDLAEVLPAGWDLTQITCVDPDGGSVVDLATATASIDLDAGEHVTCTFLNTAVVAVASVTIVKRTLPQNAGGLSFDFVGDLGTFSLTGGDSTTISDLEPGAYTLSEGALPVGWQVVDISCDDPDGGSTTNLATSTATIDLDAGERLTCTFLNQADSYVPPTPTPIPTLSAWMLLLLAGLLGVTGAWLLRSRSVG